MNIFGLGRRATRVRGVVATVLLGLASSAAAQTSPAPATDRPQFPVSQFVLEYRGPDAGLPSTGELGRTPIELGVTPDGYVAPRPGVDTVRFPLASLPDAAPKQLSQDALESVTGQLVQALADRGIGGIVVRVEGIDRGRDRRPAGQTSLGLLMTLGRIREVRTFAQGPRFEKVPEEQRVDHPRHTKIRERSPLRPEPPDDVIRIDELDDYTARLSRHPGRRVDAQLSPGREVGTTYLDYQVSENKPWLVYVQGSNTGPDGTSRWRQRFGFVHNQLTNADDIFRIDYITGNFDDVHAVFTTYERPVALENRLKLAFEGTFSQFESEQLGFAELDFRGRQWSTAFDVIYTVFQHRELFVDLSGGLKFQSIRTVNGSFGAKERTQFLLPTFGLRVERITETSTLLAGIDVEWNAAQVAGTAESPELDVHGRVSPDRFYQAIHFDASYSFYLEPLIFGDSWNDPSTPGSSTLAHEIYIGGRGQLAFDHRLTPYQQCVVGGLYSVRGYPEAIVNGDDCYYGTIEYRFHLPRAFSPNPQAVTLPGINDFRVVPAQVYGRPDWDLILRAFFDIGHVDPNDALAFESEDSLRSFGLGVELQFLRNVSVRFDVGWALNEVRKGFDNEVNRDSRQYHFVATVFF